MYFHLKSESFRARRALNGFFREGAAAREGWPGGDSIIDFAVASGGAGTQGPETMSIPCPELCSATCCLLELCKLLYMAYLISIEIGLRLSLLKPHNTCCMSSFI